MGDLKLKLNQIAAGETGAAKLFKEDIPKVFTEDWFNSFIVLCVERGWIEVHSKIMKVYFVVERESGETDLGDRADTLLYCLKLREDDDQKFYKNSNIRFDTVYTDNNGFTTNRVIRTTIEQVLANFEDVKDAKVESTFGADEAGGYHRAFSIEFKNPIYS